MRTLVMMHLPPTSKGKANPLGPLLVREAIGAPRRGLTKPFRDMLDRYGTTVTVGKRTTKQLLSRRALVYAKHSPPYKAMIEAFQKQQTKSKEAKAARKRDTKPKLQGSQPTIDKHVTTVAEQPPPTVLTPAQSPAVAPAQPPIEPAPQSPTAAPTPPAVTVMIAETPMTAPAGAAEEITPRKRPAPEQPDDGRPAKKMVIIVTDDPADLRSILQATFQS